MKNYRSSFGFGIMILFAIFALSSCSMVKNPQSASFQRVKYNSHLKMAKKQEKKELQESTTAGLKKIQAQESKLDSDISKQQPKYAYNEVLSQVNNKSEDDAAELTASTEPIYPIAQKERNVLWNPIQGTKTIKPEVLNVAPVALEDGDWGNLLYILLVVVLILLIISILADLAGGLIGALIAILLILLILRLLGYV